MANCPCCSGGSITCNSCHGKGFQWGNPDPGNNCLGCGGSGRKACLACKSSYATDLAALRAERDPVLTPAELGFVDLGPDPAEVAL